LNFNFTTINQFIFRKKRPKDNFIQSYIVLILTIFLGTSCNVKKNLKYDEYLVTKNDVELIVEGEKIKNKSLVEYDLHTLIKPKTNTKFAVFFQGHVWAHYKIQEPRNSTKERKFRNFLRKNFAEAPAIYSDSLAESSANAMTNYLKRKGYFKAEVIPVEDINEKKQTAQVLYRVYPGIQYKIDSISYTTADKNIDYLVRDLEKTSLLEKGKPVDQSLYYEEVARITDTLQNRGYAYFYPNYIESLEADSSNSFQQLDIDLNINRPYDDSTHIAYEIGEINIYPNFQPSLLTPNQKDTVINNYHIFTTDGDAGVKLQVLFDHIYLRKGNLYRKRDHDLTTNQLGNLGMYKFVNIRPEINPNQPGVLDFNIYLTPAKKQGAGIDLEANLSQRPIALSQNQWGISANLNYRNRNTFGGGELFIGSVEIGADFNFRNNTINNKRLNSIDVLARGDFYFPKFLDFIGPHRVFKNFYKDLKEKGRSRISASYNFQDFSNFYTFNTGNIAFGYDLQRRDASFSVNHVGIDYFSPIIREAFQPTFEQNPFLQRSFTRQFFTGLVIRNFNYVKNSPTTRKGFSWSWRFLGEVSGLEALVSNLLINDQQEYKIATRDTLDNGEIAFITFAHYLKAEADFRMYQLFDNDQSLAFRFRTGIASAYGGFSSEVPFVNQFFLGGTNSTRAWQIRELGPGSFYDFRFPPLLPIEAPFYQTGDFTLEFNAEYRFEIFAPFFMKGAFFIDGGNIWTIKEDTSRPGSRWSPSLPKELAIGGGYGLRFDFSYFIFRLDLGYKFKTPYVDENGRSWQFYRWNNWSLGDAFNTRNVNYNIALGLPF